ncbi:hypothetical protein ASG23_16420 [Cellulomonas sp. Leaf395]|nr:hypothetical protein ASG23_16420 [Cellulomonas sp. Leaf395]
MRLAAVAVVVLALSTLSVPARGDPPRNAVTEWNAIAVNTLIGLPGPAGGAPPAAQIHVAMVQGAVYDAVNATEPKHYRPYLLDRRFSANASKDAAVATAAYGVLHHIVSTVPNVPDAARATLLDSLAAQYATALAEVPNGAFKTQGVAAGNAAAGAMIAAREDDGRFGPSVWVPNTAPGHWWPQTNPTTGQLILDPTPWVGEVDPFVVQTASQFRTPGPSALSSAIWAQEFNEVKALGAANSTVRTPLQTYIARWWQSQPVASWNQVARDLAVRNSLSIADSARLLAMENLSGADASISCWNDKYYRDFWRPWNAIPRAAEDGNMATEPDDDWIPLISAPYPDHPSGHLCLDGAHTRVLQMFFGDVIEGGYQITSLSTLLGAADPRTRTFGSFSESVAEVTEARIWAGLHYRTADVQAKVLGWNVADYTAANYFQPVGRGH